MTKKSVRSRDYKKYFLFYYKPDVAAPCEYGSYIHIVDRRIHTGKQVAQSLCNSYTFYNYDIGVYASDRTRLST